MNPNSDGVTQTEICGQINQIFRFHENNFKNKHHKNTKKIK